MFIISLSFKAVCLFPSAINPGPPAKAEHHRLGAISSVSLSAEEPSEWGFPITEPLTGPFFHAAKTAAQAVIFDGSAFSRASARIMSTSTGLFVLGT